MNERAGGYDYLNSPDVERRCRTVFALCICRARDRICCRIIMHSYDITMRNTRDALKTHRFAGAIVRVETRCQGCSENDRFNALPIANRDFTIDVARVRTHFAFAHLHGHL